jgi:hypothetical protein
MAPLSAYIEESAQIGTPKDEFNVALAQLRVDCAYPSPLIKLSLRAVARISEGLKSHYQWTGDLPCTVHEISLAAISDNLGGRRTRWSKWDLVANYVLSCHRHAVQERPGRRDQAAAALSAWEIIYASHKAEGEGEAARAGGRRKPASQDGLRNAQARSAWQLPPHQQEFLLAHGPYGETLLARAQRGHPHARYRVALLLACDPALSEEAAALLIEVATTGHPLALDLLDGCRDMAAPTGVPLDEAGPLPRLAAQWAWNLGCTAFDHGADTHAAAFFRAAGRGGVREARLRLGEMLLADLDPEVAGWIAELAAEDAVDCHHAGEP